jgi:hypothetical protein
MSFRDKVKQAREDLVKTQDKSLKSKDDKSGGFGSIFDKTKIPEDRQHFFSAKEGDHVLDIIPWFASDQHPNIGKDKLTYLVDYWAHYKVGPMNDVVGCAQYMYRKPCPICEYMNKQRLPKEEYSNVKAKRRTTYLIWSHNSPEDERKGLQIFDIAHFCMESNLVVIASNPKGGGSIIFSDPDNGKNLVFTRKGSGQLDTKYLGHRFVDRDAPVPDHILNQSFPIELSMNLHPDYDQVAELFYQGKSGNQGQTLNPSQEPSREQERFPDDLPSGCPGGGTFGVDLNKLEGCKPCISWQDCYDVNKKLQQEQPAQQRRRRFN